MPASAAAAPSPVVGRNPRDDPLFAEGVDFPLDANNRRSTMGVNAECFAVSVQRYDPDASARIRKDARRGWRTKYAKHVVEHVKLSATSEEAALGIANAGLDYLHDTMVFVRNKRSMPFRTAMHEFSKTETFVTGTVRGRETKPKRPRGVAVPYKGKELAGDALRLQIDRWVRAGVIEVDCGAALTAVVDSEDAWLDLSDITVVMLGASSAMGPLGFLLDRGCHVIAVDIGIPRIWERLIARALASPGTLTFPLTTPQAALGKDAQALAQHAGWYANACACGGTTRHGRTPAHTHARSHPPFID